MNFLVEIFIRKFLHSFFHWSADTCSFQSASGAVESLLKYRNAGLVPPQEFNWTFLLDDWKNEYETAAPKRFLLEDKVDRGEKRIQTSLGLYKSNGVMASNESGTKVRSSYLVLLVCHEQIQLANNFFS
jgi:hypothetical protein